MERRKFLTLPLAAMAAPGAILAANAGTAHAAVPGAYSSAIPKGQTLKGVGHGGKDALALRQLKSLNLDWYYSWSSKYTVTTSPEFVPMIKDQRRMLEQNAIGYATTQMPETKSQHLLGFNEPDHPLQANMSVDEAIRLWPQLEATGFRLGSPATVSPNSPWLDEFMTKAVKAGLRVDFITTHCYGWPNASSFLKKIASLHEKYERPIWVTEYAVADWAGTVKKPTRYSRTEVNDFMKETVAGMYAMPFVERFAWKTRAAGDPVMGSSALYHSDGRLTSTGKLYASL